ncbi:HigA family addiction module antitoxin [Chlorogloeopsis fritschii PCC 9212]|uniref:HTH cro/C1-type domain-containing protein n=1 Tax=Chlorogloeopsis fritschii PCC 6912 TaxID=211165 RepID=A0A433MYJ7_CHLFR|nr:HigA family addiction module antitoxin [Chlorogloeopsis fritschii]RUR73359.1 hypothetical protein PCC6912_57170 [Chlorogloeopsis fritschii PCC 6912]
MTTNRKPRHPGALIKRQYLEPLNLTVTELATILGVSRKTVSEIVNEQFYILNYLVEIKVIWCWFSAQNQFIVL